MPNCDAAGDTEGGTVVVAPVPLGCGDSVGLSEGARDADTQAEPLRNVVVEWVGDGQGLAVGDLEELPLFEAHAEPVPDAQGLGVAESVGLLCAVAENSGVALVEREGGSDDDALGDTENERLEVRLIFGLNVGEGHAHGVALIVALEDTEESAEPLFVAATECVGRNEEDGHPEALAKAEGGGDPDALGVEDVAAVALTDALLHPDGVRDAQGKGVAVRLLQGVALAITVPLTDTLPLTLAEGVPKKVGEGVEEPLAPGVAVAPGGVPLEEPLPLSDGREEGGPLTDAWEADGGGEGEELTDTRPAAVKAGDDVVPGEPLPNAEALSQTLKAADFDTVTLELPGEEYVAAEEAEGWDAEPLMVVVGLGEGNALKEPLTQAEALPQKLTAADADTVSLALSVGEGVVAKEADWCSDMEALVVDEKEGGGVPLLVSNEDLEDVTDGVGRGDTEPPTQWQTRRKPRQSWRRSLMRCKRRFLKETTMPHSTHLASRKTNR